MAMVAKCSITIHKMAMTSGVGGSATCGFFSANFATLKVANILACYIQPVLPKDTTANTFKIHSANFSLR